MSGFFASLVLTILTSASTCYNLKGEQGACGVNFDQCRKTPFENWAQYHVGDLSCAENDPNGPVYDERHGMYHLFYQDHISIKAPGYGGGPVYGHAASRDLIHWTHLPVAIWNDQSYDSGAIFTGSATVVNGDVVHVYPGICVRGTWSNCETGTNLNIARPADKNDPFLKKWTKAPNNPIVNNTQRDPSTAWQTPSGEWQLTTFDTIIYGSTDFESWYKIGSQPGFDHGECPSFFKLPKTTPGAGPAPAGSMTPTHVHKNSAGGDHMRVGVYEPPKAAKELGMFTGSTILQKCDTGSFYASKDFYDPVKDRRILWGWATIPSGLQTLPREITWNPELQQLVFSPLEEQDQLRGDVLFTRSNFELNSELDLGLKGDAGAQAEVDLVFEIPDGQAEFGLMAGEATFTVAYDPTTKEALFGGTPVKLAASDKTISLRVYLDHIIAEAFVQGGRVTQTTALRNGGPITLLSKGSIKVVSANVWSVKPIWVSEEEVLKTPRADDTRGPKSILV